MSPKHWILALIAFTAIAAPATAIPAANEQTVGLFLNAEGAFDGFTLFAPVSFETTYLIDNDGMLVHSWESEYKPSLSGYLLENGNLLRGAKLPFDPAFGAGGGRVEELAWAQSSGNSSTEAISSCCTTTSSRCRTEMCS